MADDARLLKAREVGLNAARKGALPRDAGLDLRGKGRAPPSADGRAKRPSLAPALLAVSLILGAAQLATFIGLEFAPTGAPGALAGQVVDEGDAPLVNATVTVAGSNITQATDAGGNFTLRGLPSGKTVISIAKENYTNTTFTVYVNAAPSGGVDPRFRDVFTVTRGSGSAAVDYIGTRDAVVQTCLVVFVAGNVLTAAGLTAAVTRRRYRMALLGGVGAVLSIGFYLGALFGLVAILLLRGARADFKDQRSLFTPSDVPSLLDAEKDNGEGEADGEEGTEGEPDEPEGSRITEKAEGPVGPGPTPGGEEPRK